MEKLERTQTGLLVPNGETIIAGYGRQGKEENSGKMRLKFARFKASGFENDTIWSINKDAAVCSGRF